VGGHARPQASCPPPPPPGPHPPRCRPAAAAARPAARTAEGHGQARVVSAKEVIEGVRFRSKLYHSGLLVGAMIEKSRVPDSGRQRRAGEEVAGYCSLRTPSI
ncbi:unnamed protein product, partial [Prorocentrum cordatum]